MKLLFIIGNSSVGKMTVGQEIAKITDLKLFHNHMVIEPVLDVFGDFNSKAVSRIRSIYFEEFSKTNNYGMMFTFMWAFDRKEDWDYIESVKNIFLNQNKDTQFYYVELVTSQQIRLERNITENRLKNKASKNDLEASKSRLLEGDIQYRLESNEGEIKFDNYLKIDNSNLEPSDLAKIIKAKFDL